LRVAAIRDRAAPTAPRTLHSTSSRTGLTSGAKSQKSTSVSLCGWKPRDTIAPRHDNVTRNAPAGRTDAATITSLFFSAWRHSSRSQPPPPTPLDRQQPNGKVTDFAGRIDADSKTELESFRRKLKDEKKVQAVEPLRQLPRNQNAELACLPARLRSGSTDFSLRVFRNKTQPANRATRSASTTQRRCEARPMRWATRNGFRHPC
jgi:hypothetical protein